MNPQPNAGRGPPNDPDRGDDRPDVSVNPQPNAGRGVCIGRKQRPFFGLSEPAAQRGPRGATLVGRSTVWSLSEPAAQRGPRAISEK